MLLAGQSATVTGASTSSSTAASAHTAVISGSLSGSLSGLGIPKSPSFHSSLELAAAAKDLKAAATQQQQQQQQVLLQSGYSAPATALSNHYDYTMPSSSSTADAKVRSTHAFL